MTKIIAIANQKGGVGKTTTSVNLSAYLAEMGEKVLLIDIDPQGNATSGLGVSKEEIEYSTYDLMIKKQDIYDIIISTSVSGLYLVPANIQLAGAEIELVNILSRETVLKKSIQKIINDYDFIIIDAPPSLGLLTINALAAATDVIIPVQAEYYALEGLTQLLNTIELVREHINPSLEIMGLLITMYDKRTNISQEVAKQAKDYFKEKVFHTFIPRSVRLSEAPSFGKPINLYDPASKGAEAYRGLAKEVMEIG